MELPASHAAVRTRRFRPDRLKASAPLLAVVVVLAIVGLSGSTLWVDVANQAIIAAIAAIGLSLLLGHAGLISVGNAAFLAIGAFTVAKVSIAYGVPFPVAVVGSGLVCALVGTVVALPSFRISGLYLAMSTLAFHFVAIWGLRQLQTHDVGDAGYAVPVATIFGVEIVELRTWLVLLGLVVVGVLLTYRWLIESKVGRALHAIRERPALAAMSGISVTKYKVAAFGSSSFLVGIAGALHAYYIGRVSYANYESIDLAIEYLGMVIIGGLGTIYGPVIGAALIVSLPHLVHALQGRLGLDRFIAAGDIFLVQGALVGLVVAAMVIFQPGGLIGIGRSVRRLTWRRSK
ncbi:branched-chain amino acid ABC transporter permease [Georgenia yuyongxinii]|uniref:branched-chain amino acid ABC transporter permease n=1 Tax=Georgenia yuyongxinii TaxID=2589797 RepID=UPI00163DC503|nr:branched-chain amino acid ABC transporter permease [Georgenia yuyongxinii]